MRYKILNKLITAFLLLSCIFNCNVKKVEAASFPESYQERLSELSKKHPNWEFEAVYVKMDFFECLKEQMGKRSVIRNSSDFLKNKNEGFYLPYKNRYLTWDHNGWVAANSFAVQYFLDPRNFLDEDNIFMFEKNTYDSELHNKSEIEKILKDTFMSNKTVTYKDQSGKEIVTDKTYADIILEAGEKSNASPYYLASRIRNEVCLPDGSGSNSTTGTYKNYKGYYNFYNIKAYDSEDPVSKGLEYAKTETQGEFLGPWDSPEKSIIGGALWISNSYISKGQDTVYFQRFNTSPYTCYPVHTHQYYTAILGATSTVSSISKAYKQVGIFDSPKKFIIPVYDNMPENSSREKCTIVNQLGEINYQGTDVYDGPGLEHNKINVLFREKPVEVLKYCQTDSTDFAKFIESPYWAEIKFLQNDIVTKGYIQADLVDLCSKVEIKSGSYLNIDNYFKNDGNTFFESSNFNIIKIDESGNILAGNPGEAAVYAYINGRLQVINFLVS